MAVSIESDPPLVKNTLASAIGASPATRSASAAVGGFIKSPNVEYAASSRSWRGNRVRDLGAPVADVANHRPAVASR